MWNKLVGSIDFGKLTINSISGFFAFTALLLFVDAFTPGHLTQEFFNTNVPAGKIVVDVLMVVIGSTALGLLADNLYATTGRWYASKFWKPLQAYFNYRNCLMENLGLSKEEFEWVQNDAPALASETESKYLRYTEVTGSSAIALMFLAIALAPFMRFEFNLPVWLALAATFIVGSIAAILNITSAASLAKYEMNKTASAMAVIRKMSSHNLTYEETSPGSGLFKLYSKNSWWMLVSLVIIVIISYVLINPWSAKVLDPVNRNAAISVPNNDGSIPTLEINIITDKITLPDPVYRSIAVQLEKSVKGLSLVAPPGSNTAVNSVTPLSAITLTGPKMTSDSIPWNLDVNIGDVIQANNTVILNAQFSPANPVYPCTWLYPVLVNDDKGKSNYLLAYIKVTITPATVQTTTILSNGTTTNKTETPNSASGGTTTTNIVTTNVITTNAATTTVK
jgi:hypothetical protein